jgi:ubiquinone/menaquinone biosynthesis C-methylase UbiE
MKGDYYQTKESVTEYIKLAEGYHGGQLIKKFREFLSDNSHLLEIGSGPGTDWKMLTEYFKVVGSDYSVEFLKRLMANHPNEEFLELDAISLATDKVFDGIYSNKVLHHLKDEEITASIKRQHEILNAGGVICHSFWKGEGSEYFNGLFVNYHSAEDLVSLFKDYFEILVIEDYKEFDADDSILLIGKKK